jgi:hypothetical protein
MMRCTATAWSDVYLDEVLDELPARLVDGTGAYAAALNLTC